ncbi:MAG: YjbQ family protein [Spirochaetales bacterium]|nr:YjbQ family protein [Spirochaetales bacterium]
MYNTLQVQTRKREEFRDITARVKTFVAESGIKNGFCNVYVPHTTAGVTINEAADPAVVADIIKEIDTIVPLDDHYKHMEGNSAAHIKSSLFGISIQVPVHDGRLVLGTWQGIYFCEFDGPRQRSCHLSVIGT